MGQPRTVARSGEGRPRPGPASHPARFSPYEAAARGTMRGIPELLLPGPEGKRTPQQTGWRTPCTGGGLAPEARKGDGPPSALLRPARRQRPVPSHPTPHSCTLQPAAGPRTSAHLTSPAGPGTARLRPWPRGGHAHADRARPARDGRARGAHAQTARLPHSPARTGLAAWPGPRRGRGAGVTPRLALGAAAGQGAERAVVAPVSTLRPGRAEGRTGSSAGEGGAGAR